MSRACSKAVAQRDTRLLQLVRSPYFYQAKGFTPVRPAVKGVEK